MSTFYGIIAEFEVHVQHGRHSQANRGEVRHSQKTFCSTISSLLSLKATRHNQCCRWSCPMELIFRQQAECPAGCSHKKLGKWSWSWKEWSRVPKVDEKGQLVRGGKGWRTSWSLFWKIKAPHFEKCDVVKRREWQWPYSRCSHSVKTYTHTHTHAIATYLSSKFSLSKLLSDHLKMVN